MPLQTAKELSLEELLDKEPSSARHTHFVLKKSESPVLHVAKIDTEEYCVMVCYDFGLIAEGYGEAEEEVKNRLHAKIIDHLLFHYSNNRMKELFDTGFDITADSPWNKFIKVNREKSAKLWTDFLREISSDMLPREQRPDKVELNTDQIEKIKNALSLSAVEENAA